MAKQFPALTDDHIAFIADQHVFFSGTAASEGRVNVSPKGMDSLRVTGSNRIVWRNLTGSGNETAGHLLLNPRMTLMWCSFATRPIILRVYGKARTIQPGDTEWDALNGMFAEDRGARQVYDLTIDLVQTSCGYAVPLLDNPRERDVLRKWSASKGDEAMLAYRAEKNRKTVDGFPTGLPE
jgi:Pyridoxamine 5'-phosphate oxidase